DGTNGRELWRSDGTPAGTMLVRDIAPSAAASLPSNLTNVNGLLYFAANDGTTGTELWQSDGTPAGTVLVQDINPGTTGSNPAYLTAMNNKLSFAAPDPTHGRELWDPPPVERAGYLLVGSFDADEVPRYNASTGTFVDELVTRRSGGLIQPYGIVFGPYDHNL